MTAPRVTRLARLADLPERRIVGLMSGTSLDGLDVALCRVRGAGPGTQAEAERFVTLPYAPAQQARLRAVVSQGGAQPGLLREVCLLNAWLARLHAGLALRALADWGVAPAAVHLLASHGQTVYHAPAAAAEDPAGEAPFRATLQLGDGDLLAVRTGIVTVSDFRQKEIAGGGQGAPLAPYAEDLLFRGEAPRALVNLGGIANFTWLPPLGDPRPPRCGDTGPGNTLIDRAVRRCFPAAARGFDAGGELAARGRVHAPLLAALKAHPYFALPSPKSTGPEAFGAEFLAGALAAAGAAALPSEDIVATVTRLTAETVAEALRRAAPLPAGGELFVSGGGLHNRTLMGWLAGLLPDVQVRDSRALGMDPDAKEALLFAVLANETVAGAGFLARDGSGRRLGFGKVSFPD